MDDSEHDRDLLEISSYVKSVIITRDPHQSQHHHKVVFWERTSPRIIWRSNTESDIINTLHLIEPTLPVGKFIICIFRAHIATLLALRFLHLHEHVGRIRHQDIRPSNYGKSLSFLLAGIHRFIRIYHAFRSI